MARPVVTLNQSMGGDASHNILKSAVVWTNLRQRRYAIRKMKSCNAIARFQVCRQAENKIANGKGAQISFSARWGKAAALP